MIFTSYTYIVFLCAMFLLYWGAPTRWRRFVLIAGSYFFYCTWDWRFGFLLLGLSVFNWAYGAWLARKKELSWQIWVGILVNLSPLLYFKYTNFILTNVSAAFQIVGGSWQYHLLNIILPLGISFFTFQGVAYLVDIWAGDKPFDDIWDFLLFKAFWPQLIAGPIIRAHEIYGQITSERCLNYGNLASGLQRILFGFFKKAVLADSLAPFVDSVFLHGAAPNAIDALVGALGFGLQIYFDFSGYSDIAIGSAKLFGFSFPENFNWPYAASSPQDFWNRWHMTLSRWIRDYVFTPIRFATRDYPRMAALWLVAAMTVCGFWHGAQWTFILWGAWHGILLVLNQTGLKAFFMVKKNDPRYFIVGLKQFVAWGTVFLFVNLAWILFRATTLSDAFGMFSAILTLKGGLRPAVLRENAILFIGLVSLGLVVLQIFKDKIEAFFSPEKPGLLQSVARGFAYSMLIVAITIFEKSSKAFVYFQF